MSLVAGISFQQSKTARKLLGGAEEKNKCRISRKISTSRNLLEKTRDKKSFFLIPRSK